MNNQNFCERRLQTHKLARELFIKREHVRDLREQLVSLQPYRPEQRLKPLVRQFCQELIDYISLEHFGIFHHLVNGHENRSGILALAEEIFPQMIETTDTVLDFNDKIVATPSESLDLALPDELLILGDALALRYELEDRLIEGMTA